jgi:hypothetical protein
MVSPCTNAPLVHPARYAESRGRVIMSAGIAGALVHVDNRSAVRLSPDCRAGVACLSSG